MTAPLATALGDRDRVERARRRGELATIYLAGPYLRTNRLEVMTNLPEFVRAKLAEGRAQ